MTRKESL